MKHIDPHCHCRDGKEAYKTTIREVSEIAEKQGIVAIFDMPNTNPPILTEKDVKKRLELVKKRKPKVKYFLYVGLTSEEKQIKEAVEVVQKYPQVVGLKLYKPNEEIYRILAKLGYQGVLAVHCEKERYLRPFQWDPKRPWTHSWAWPVLAEVFSVNDQIRFAKMSNFQGNLHICHISCPESVDLVWEAKKDLNITCGVTPHHILFSNDLLRETKNGLLYKVNPPLRDLKRVKELRKRLFEKKVDWIETDHAPHTWEEKLTPPYLSGVPSLHLYQGFLVWLNSQGMIWPEIKRLTYWNIKRAFGEKVRDV